VLARWYPNPKANPGTERPGVRNPSGPREFELDTIHDGKFIFSCNWIRLASG
jgi:hypothetical protein